MHSLGRIRSMPSRLHETLFCVGLPKRYHVIFLLSIKSTLILAFLGHRTFPAS